jgi:hypothetical protein
MSRAVVVVKPQEPGLPGGCVLRTPVTLRTQVITAGPPSDDHRRLAASLSLTRIMADRSDCSAAVRPRFCSCARAKRRMPMTTFTIDAVRSATPPASLPWTLPVVVSTRAKPAMPARPAAKRLASASRSAGVSTFSS